MTDEALDRAVARTLTELFALGMFENPYRDPDEAARIVEMCIRDRAYVKTLSVKEKIAQLFISDWRMGGISGVPVSSTARYASVSYTHLDVYKRQIPALRLKHRSGGCGTASALPKCSIRHPVLSALLA